MYSVLVVYALCLCCFGAVNCNGDIKVMVLIIAVATVEDSDPNSTGRGRA